MSCVRHGVLSSVKQISPCTRDDKHVYLRTNITKVHEVKKNLLGKDIDVSYWKYDEEILTHSEYTLRLEEKLARSESQNLDLMLGIAEIYEMLIEKGVI